MMASARRWLGYALLGQLLSGWQMVGMALVVGAVISARAPAALGMRLGSPDPLAAVLLVGGLVFLLAALALVS